MNKETEILFEAYHAPQGIEVEVFGNIYAALQKLYVAKRKHRELDDIQIYRPPHSNTHLWIMKTPDRPLAEFASQTRTKEQLFSLGDILKEK